MWLFEKVATHHDESHYAVEKYKFRYGVGLRLGLEFNLYLLNVTVKYSTMFWHLCQN